MVKVHRYGYRENLPYSISFGATPNVIDREGFDVYYSFYKKDIRAVMKLLYIHFKGTRDGFQDVYFEIDHPHQCEWMTFKKFKGYWYRQ